MAKLYLDDIREAPIGWDVVRSYDEFVRYIDENGVPDFISFDHDLSFDHYPLAENNPHPTEIPYDSYTEKTGYHCARYLVDNNLPLPRDGWAVHSMNVVGKQNIEALLQLYARHLKTRS